MQNAVGLWGGVKGWTADRLRRSSRDGWESSDEDDDDVLLDQSLDPDDSGVPPLLCFTASAILACQSCLNVPFSVKYLPCTLGSARATW